MGCVGCVGTGLEVELRITGWQLDCHDISRLCLI